MAGRFSTTIRSPISSASLIEWVMNTAVLASVACPLRSTGITPLQHYYGAVRPSPAHQYFRPRGWSRLCLFPWHRRPGSHVPYKSQIEVRAASMPDAAWAVSGHPPSYSQRNGNPPVLASPNPLSTRHQRFACARLSQSCLPKSCFDFPQRSPPSLLTTAPCGGLRSTPDCRPRRALLHLSYSYAPSYPDGTRDTRPISDISAITECGRVRTSECHSVRMSAA